MNINQSIQKQKTQLLHHSLYSKVQKIEDLYCFLENHVYAVWDFMSLLKALQNSLTCTTTPWLPVGNPEIRYLINEIVVAEETDLTIDGKRQSHYEMYVDAMKQCRSVNKTIRCFYFISRAVKKCFSSNSSK